MKTNIKKETYQSPALEVLEIETEQCFAVSGGTEDMEEIDDWTGEEDWE